MARYFFDTRDDAKRFRDEVGYELFDLEAVKVLASKSLVELAADALPGSLNRCLGVDVRDDQNRDVLTTQLTFKARVLVT
jgi:hypothetical protein